MYNYITTQHFICAHTRQFFFILPTFRFMLLFQEIFNSYMQYTYKNNAIFYFY